MVAKSSAPGPTLEETVTATHTSGAPASFASRSVLPSAAPAPADPQSRYEFQGELGRGGMGSVDRVFDTLTGETLAMKRLLISSDSEQSKRRHTALFEREYHTLAQLTHPRIIQAFDYGVDDRGPYYTMELLQGQDLKALTPVPWKRACEIARDVASSLAIVHARGFVHRDVTPGNIRCTDDGHAKLLDFGAMCPMGIARKVVGTPPFIAPEALDGRALDGRTDLFALGASLYFCMTGRHAFPARQLGRLRDVWRTAPRSLGRLVKDVPDRLDRLVMELLSINPIARPPSAAVVLQQLTAIAELPRDEALEVSGAYLHTPTLVGRDAQLHRCRQWLFKAVRARGRSVLVSGAAGVGRSRMLDAIALEAKLAGALLLRADASDAQSPGGALGRLTEQIRQVWDDDLGEPPVVAPESPHGEARKRFLQNFLGAVSKMATFRPITLVVDDLHSIDELSLAGLANLAPELARKRVLLITAVERDAPTASRMALDLLAKNSHSLHLKPLDRGQVGELLSSVFGAVDNLHVVGSILFDYSDGNPARIVEAAQALGDAGIVTYEAGGWVLPDQADAVRAGLPTDTSLGARLASVPEDAREIAALLALEVHGVIGLPDYAGLTEHGDAGRVHRALRSLVAAHVVAPSGESYRLARSNYHRQIDALQEAETRQALHERLGRLMTERGLPSAAAHHASLCQDWDAVAHWARELTFTDMERLRVEDVTCVPTLERALAGAGADVGMPQGHWLAVRCCLVTLCALSSDWARLSTAVRPALEALRERCGLVDYEQLSEVPESERLTAAINRAEARQEAAPEDVGAAMPLITALQQLPSVVLISATTGYLVIDLTLVDSLPSLEPLYPLSKAYPVVNRLRRGIGVLCHGDSGNAHDVLREVTVELSVATLGLDATAQASLERVCQGFLQGVEAMMGFPEVLVRAAVTEETSPERAEGERRLYYLAIGDADAAAAAQRQLEQLQVGAGRRVRYPEAWVPEFSVSSFVNDVPALKRCEREAAAAAEFLPGWRYRLELVRIALARCGGTNPEMVPRIEELVRDVPRESTEYRYVLAQYLEALLELGRYQECVAIASAHPTGLQRPLNDVHLLSLAMAQSKLEQHDAARRTVDECIELRRDAGVVGVMLGRIYEAGAYIALGANDEEAFARDAELCADVYKVGHNQALTARYETLMRTARERHVSVGEGLERAADFVAAKDPNTLYARYRTQLTACADARARYQTGLTTLCQSSGATTGLLYQARADGPVRVATVGQLSPSQAALASNVAGFWTEQLAPTDDVTLTVADMLAAASALDMRVGEFGLNRFLLEHDGKACGVVMLAAGAGTSIELDFRLLEVLAELMLQEDDTVGVSLLSSTNDSVPR